MTDSLLPFRAWQEAQAFRSNAAGVNFAIDTGMGRMGCWQDDAMAELEKMSRIPGLKFTAFRPICRWRKKTRAFTENEMNQF